MTKPADIPQDAQSSLNGQRWPRLAQYAQDLLQFVLIAAIAVGVQAHTGQKVDATTFLAGAALWFGIRAYSISDATRKKSEEA